MLTMSLSVTGTGSLNKFADSTSFTEPVDFGEILKEYEELNSRLRDIACVNNSV
jgi:hypothetical protein